MTGAQSAERMSYEEGLRVIGRHLDAEPVYGMTIREQPDGFEVTFSSREEPVDLRTNHFSWQRLSDLVVFFASGRGLVRKQGRYTGFWATVPNGHQGFLRALGFRLDLDSASDLELRETAEGVTVTYHRTGEGSKDEKVALDISLDEIRTMLESAQQRRA